MKLLARLSLLLVITLVVVSAYLRLAHSGIGCADWPACYGQIGAQPLVEAPVSTATAYERIVAEADQPLAWATPLHRLVASILGLLVVFLNVLALKARRHRLLCLALLALTVFLALLGVKSGGLHSPAVVMGNLLGGFLMLGFLGWLVFATSARPSGLQATRLPNPLVCRWTLLAIALLSAQVFLGGLTSANFAATACQTFPDCHGSWWPGSEVFAAFDLSAEHPVNSQGVVIGGAERAGIHMTHRLGGIATLLAILVTAVLALKAERGLRATAVVILVLVILEFSAGVAAVLSQIPIGLAVAHNGLAGLLLLGLLKLLNLSKAER